ncbi:MAG: pseudouridine-5'-phosphate glycosidase [Kofleriaceae bacterium]
MQLTFAPAVADALERGAPVVALESTIIAHGLPYPANLDVAHQLEAAVVAEGATPATIAVVDGAVQVGLAPAQLARLATDGARFAKAGATDLAVHLARRTSAATTVSATATIAAAAGIRVFATGGIGGVHRGDAGDVSHDLTTLARIPIAVVSAGAKAILDLPRTLEVLETLGVLVIGYQTDELPGFYTRTTGLGLDHRVDDAATLAAICRLRFGTLGQGGVLVCNPIPAAAALDRVVIDAVIDDAIAAAAAAGATGKRLTPLLLSRIAAATAGAAVAANRALAVHNATVAAQLAVALAA